MNKRKTITSIIISFCFLMFGIFSLTACGEKAINAINIVFDQSVGAISPGSQLVIDEVYGQTKGLDSIKIVAKYSDGSESEIQDAEITIYYHGIGDESSSLKTLEEFKTKAKNNTLDAGVWELTASYKGHQTPTTYVNIDRAESTKDYNLRVTSNIFSSKLQANSLYYGTQEAGYNITLLNGSQVVDNSMIDGLYKIKDGEEFDASKSIQEYVDNNKTEYVTIENLYPGTYTIFAKVKAETNFNEKYTNALTLKILKAPVEIDTTDMKVVYQFGSNTQHLKDLTFAQIDDGVVFNDITNGINGGYVIICSDGDSSNNGEEVGKILSSEIVVSTRNVWVGKFVAVENHTYNVRDNGKMIKLKFVPSSDEDFRDGYKYSDLFAPSEVVEVPMEMIRGKIHAPIVTSAFGESDGTNYSNYKAGDGLHHYLKITYDENNKNVLFDITYDSDVTQDSGGFYATTAGRHFVRFSIINENFEFRFDGKDDNYAYEINYYPPTITSNAYIDFVWTLDPAE